MSAEAAYPPGQSQGDVALLSGVDDLHLKVVAACGEGPAGLGQTHVGDAPPLPHVLQELRRGGEERGAFTINIKNTKWTHIRLLLQMALCSAVLFLMSMHSEDE